MRPGVQPLVDCQVVHVTTFMKPVNTVYKLHGQVVEVVTSAKNLGVDISSGLFLEYPHRSSNC